MTSFSEKIQTRISPSFQYDSIYVSIGGKINEYTVNFRKPAGLTNYDFQSNAPYQMVPAFIRYPRSSSSKTLIVVIDDFTDSDLREMNQRFVFNMHERYPHIHVILYDIKLTSETVDDFAKSLVQWIVNQNIAPAKCMIVNYLRFRGCLSVVDSQIEFTLPRVVQNALNNQYPPNMVHSEYTKSRAPYSDILYQWFGYQFYTYNIIFSYREYTAYMLSHLSIMNILNECCENTQLVSGNVSNIFMYERSRELKSVQLLFRFLNHSVDITSYSKHPTMICSRLCDYIPTFMHDIVDFNELEYRLDKSTYSSEGTVIKS